MVVDFTEACRRAALMVDDFVEGAASEGTESERSCLADLFLALTPAEAELVVVSGANPTGQASEDLLEEFLAEVGACR